MRIFLIIGEDHFYHPGFVANLIKNAKDEVVGAALVTKAPKKADLQKYLAFHFYYLKPFEILKLGWFTAKFRFLDFSHSGACPRLTGMPRIRKEGVSGVAYAPQNDIQFYSVRSVFKKYNIDYFEVDSNINNPEYIKKMRDKKPDVIISSNPWIFKEELLNLPEICCINRHSSLLPAYGGLWPVFHAVVRGEKYTGVTVHTMVKEIDKGIILSQKEVEILVDDTISDLYKKTFEESVPAVLEALDKIRNGDFKSVKNNYANSYHSFPTKEDWARLRELKRKFI